MMELHIREVSKTYSNGVHALKDVTLTIPVGTQPSRRFAVILMKRQPAERKDGSKMGLNFKYKIPGE